MWSIGTAEQPLGLRLLLGQRQLTVVSGPINPDWDCLQANQMSTSYRTENLVCSF
jgi:hypothetical protein